MKNKFIIVMLVMFVAISAILHFVEQNDHAYRFTVLESGNLIMAALCIGSLIIVMRQLGKAPAAFIRGVMGASFLKLMVCMIAVLVYVMLNRQHIHKPTVFILLGIYAVYAAVETVMLSKLARE